MKIKIDDFFEREVINLPSSKDYFRKSRSLFFESFISFLKILEKIYFNSPENVFKEHFVDIINKLHKSCEIHMSGLIFEQNPMLLIKVDSVFEYSDDIDFDSCITVDANKLLEILKNIKKKEDNLNFFNSPFQNKKFADIYHKNRKIRNKDTHGLINNENLDYKEILFDFLSIYFIFHKEKYFMKDLYEEIMHIEEKNSQEDVNCSRNDFYDLLESSIEFKRCMNKKLLDNLTLIEKYIDKNEFEILTNVKINHNKFVCPNCENSNRTYDGEDRHRFDSICPTNDIYKEDSNLPSLRSLIEIKKGKLSKCYICDFEITKKDLIKQSCKCCAEMNQDKLKTFVKCRDEIFDRMHETCLNCGCTDRDLERM
jgi:hypothetical protein